MARKNKKEINQIAQDVSNLLDNMYIDTNKTNPTNALDLAGIQTKATESLKNMTQANMDATGTGAFSQIVGRLSDTKGTNAADRSDLKSLQDIFTNFDPDGNVTGSLLSMGEHRAIKDYDAEIDMVCEYMPILTEAIDAKKDSVLSADQFDKDFLNIRNTAETKDFNDRVNSLKRTYDLLNRAEEIYDDTSYYGEYFLYIAPYGTEIKKMLDIKKSKQTVNNVAENTAIYESYQEAMNESTVIHESIAMDDSKESFFDLQVDYSGFIDSAIQETNGIVEMNKIANKFSRESIISEAKNNDEKPSVKRSGKKKKKTTKGLVSDGVLDSSANDQLNSIPGAIVKKLDRANILPLYISDDQCFGYFYSENMETVERAGGNTSHPNQMGASTGGLNKTLHNSTDTNKVGYTPTGADTAARDGMLQNVARQIADRITPKFIVNNQAFKSEIYTLLKSSYNDEAIGMKMTFIPAEFVEHIYWSKDESHRGISDLAKSMVPAKLYIGLYTANTIGILTRGFDKRVYYVKNTVDTNISQNLMSAINIIKAGNKGMRDFSAVKSIINSTGRFNDLLIPTNKSGEAPVDFSIMEGQNIDTKESLMEQLEHMAVAPTGVPYEFLMSRKTVDYAVRLTMANGKFLKDTYKRQGRFEQHLTRIITKIYNYEFNASEDLKVSLPPPAYLSILNANQMIDNVNNMVSLILDINNTDNLDEHVLLLAKKKLSEKFLSGYVDFDMIDDVIQTAVVAAAPANGESGEE